MNRTRRAVIQGTPKKKGAQEQKANTTDLPKSSKTLELSSRRKIYNQQHRLQSIKI